MSWEQVKKYREENGLCMVCGAARDNPTKLCQQCRTANSERRKADRVRRKQLGVCIICGRPDAFTMNGRSYCGTCMDRHKRLDEKPERVEKVRDYGHAVYEFRKQNRLCAKCGTELPDGYQFVLCETCRDTMNRKRTKTGRRYSHVKGKNDS